jgi:hypothetical protein
MAQLHHPASCGSAQMKRSDARNNFGSDRELDVLIKDGAGKSIIQLRVL